MKTHTTNYYDTFIEVAPDCPAATGEVPPVKGGVPSVAAMQYEMISKHPYQYTSDEVMFGVYAGRNDISASEREAARAQFFSKGQPCFRASPLTKRYGWGIHCNSEGKVALYGCETEAYQGFAADEKLKRIKAMKSAK